MNFPLLLQSFPSLSRMDPLTSFLSLKLIFQKTQLNLLILRFYDFITTVMLPSSTVALKKYFPCFRKFCFHKQNDVWFCGTPNITDNCPPKERRRSLVRCLLEMLTEC